MLTKLSSKTLAPITTPNIIAVLINANCIPTNRINNNLILAQANNIA